ncbi:glycosyl hydrolase [Microdochium trichocladiopsis]|uniref:Glycosyl hydrolase n=1 Tax=Microdochium trichocladiopsis TaxID=1682393 RepID=A0A9P8YJ46_9PEZI|nr:glycosyl hydrolase [Microdochium trichocladiopsis]KAH7041451.1 glycosyl hydrolase [Microdochium trichocladiopsis]
MHSRLTSTFSFLAAVSLLSPAQTLPWGVAASPLLLQKRVSPVLAGFNADPNIIVFGDTYYIYPTNDGENWEGKSFYVWKSKDLVSWTKSAEPILTLDGVDVPWSDGKAWAPGIIQRGEKYYFYHSGSNPATADLSIGVAVAPSPEGPFTAHAEPIITNRDPEPVRASGAAIDPMAFHDPVSGRWFLLWGNGRAPVIAELNEDMLGINWPTAREISGLEGYFEAPFVFFRDGLYHMTWSVDDTREPTYHVAYATSTDLLGGQWANHGTLLEQDPSLGIRGTGHQSFVNVPGTDDWYIAYHRFAVPGGDGMHRETTIDRVFFDEAGVMKKIVPTLEGVPAQAVP